MKNNFTKEDIKEIKLELGENISDNIDDYATISGYNKETCTLDIKEININKAGRVCAMYDKEKGIYPSGEYLVGDDIETGKYLLTSRGQFGGTVTFYENYQNYLKDENLKVIEFDEEYHLSLRENGMFIVVEYADMKKI